MQKLVLIFMFAIFVSLPAFAIYNPQWCDIGNDCNREWQCRIPVETNYSMQVIGFDDPLNFSQYAIDCNLIGTINKQSVVVVFHSDNYPQGALVPLNFSYGQNFSDVLFQSVYGPGTYFIYITNSTNTKQSVNIFQPSSWKQIQNCSQPGVTTNADGTCYFYLSSTRLSPFVMTSIPITNTHHKQLRVSMSYSLVTNGQAGYLIWVYSSTNQIEKYLTSMPGYTHSFSVKDVIIDASSLYNSHYLSASLSCPGSGGYAGDCMFYIDKIKVESLDYLSHYAEKPQSIGSISILSDVSYLELNQNFSVILRNTGDEHLDNISLVSNFYPNETAISLRGKSSKEILFFPFLAIPYVSNFTLEVMSFDSRYFFTKEILFYKKSEEASAHANITDDYVSSETTQNLSFFFSNPLNKSFDTTDIISAENESILLPFENKTFMQIDTYNETLFYNESVANGTLCISFYNPFNFTIKTLQWFYNKTLPSDFENKHYSGTFFDLLPNQYITESVLLASKTAPLLIASIINTTSDVPPNINDFIPIEYLDYKNTSSKSPSSTAAPKAKSNNSVPKKQVSVNNTQNVSVIIDKQNISSSQDVDPEPTQIQFVPTGSFADMLPIAAVPMAAVFLFLAMILIKAKKVVSNS